MKVIQLVLYFMLVSTFYAAVIGGSDIQGGANFGHEERCYLAALRSFRSSHWGNASSWIEKLIKEFPDSSNRSKAVLLLGQSYYKQNKLRESYGCLSNNIQIAGNLSDEYIYWMAECRVKQGNFSAADQHFLQIIENYPDSKRLLEATIGSAAMAAKRQDWAKVVQVLHPNDGVFQVAGGQAFDSVLLQEGCLLLVKALLKQRDGKSAALMLAKLPRTMETERGWRRSILHIDTLMMNGRSEEAISSITQLRDILKEAGANASWQITAAKIHSKILETKGNMLRAAEIYESLTGESNEVAVRTCSYLESARLHKVAGNHQVAINLLKKLTDISDQNSTLAHSFFLIGEMEMVNGGPEQYQVAREFFEKASNLEKVDGLGARIHMRIGECLMRAGKAERAISEFHKAQKLTDEFVISSRVAYLDGLAKASLGQVSDAVESFSSITQMVNSQKGESYSVADCARFMIFKSYILQSNIDAAESQLARARAEASTMLPYYLFGMAQVRIESGDLAAAKEFLVELDNKDKGKDLSAVAELENIRIHILKQNWIEAIQLYDRWLAAHPNHSMREKVFLDRAWVLFRSGRKAEATKAYQELSLLKANVPEVFVAKLWIADQNFNSNTNRLEAEKIYQEVASETNCPPYLRHRSQLMAGRAALVRQGYDDARKSFVALLDSKDVSDSDKIRATFALGDLTMIELKASPAGLRETDTIRVDSIHQSTNAFFSLTQISQTNIVTARAWGRIGDVSLMVAQDRNPYYVHANIAYEKSREILENILKSMAGPSDVDDILNQSLMGLAYCADRSSSGKEAKIRKPALENALRKVIDVYDNSYGEPGKKVNMYWRAQSGVVAIRFMTELGQYDDALQKCRELEKLFPGMQEFFKAKKQRLVNLRDAKP